MTAPLAPARSFPARGFSGTGSAARLTVDLNAVAANTRLLAGRARGALMAVVKADGFGHGAAAVARTALGAGATWLGVTGVAEALALRAAGLSAPILSWLNPIDTDFALAARHTVDLAVPSLAHLAAMPPGARVHLHLDTGMARDGAAPEIWAGLCRAARQAELAGRLQVVGVMSHLAGPDPDDATRRFEDGLAVARAAGLRPQVRHLAATAAALTAPRTHYDLVRCGAGLVGIDPSGSFAIPPAAAHPGSPGRLSAVPVDALAFGLQSAFAAASHGGAPTLRGAMTLTAPVVDVRRVTAGTPVGYDHTWRAPYATTLALLPVGYADGIPRTAGPNASVLLGGRRCRIAGRVSMDQIVVDTGLPGTGGRLGPPGGRGAEVRAGEVAVIFGPGPDGEPTVDEWAGWAGTLPHEIVTGIGTRPQRFIIGGN